MNGWIASALAPALISWAAIAILRRTAWSARLADHPNERSLHADPTPRLGGLGVLAGTLAFVALHASGALAMTFACALVLALLGLVDDLRGLPVRVRLAVQFVAAAAAMLAIAGWPEGLGAWAGLAWAAAVVAIVWTTNLFNFMDGADGLAGGMAAVGFTAYAIAAAAVGQVELALLAAALASASVGFLFHNFPPARVFLGDSGSIPLGFLAGALGLHGVVSDAWPVAFPLLVFSPFIVDATVTLLRRALRREPVWQAHRGHYYQRLVLAGWTRRRLALSAYALMLATAASALVLGASGPMLQCAIILIWAALYALLLLAIDRKTKNMAATAQ